MNAKYTKTAGVLAATGLFVLTLTNATTVFSQASEVTSLTSVFKKVSELELVAAVGDAPATQEAPALTKAQVHAKLQTLRTSGKTGIALFESFLNTTEAKAQEQLFLEVAKEQFPDSVNLIVQVATEIGFSEAAIVAATGYTASTGAGDQPQQQNTDNNANAAAGAGGGGAPVSPTNVS